MQLLPPTIITTAGTGTSAPAQIRQSPNSQGEAMAVVAQMTFTYGSGGTTLNVRLQTSFDGGSTWCDAASFTQLTTASGKAVAAISSTTSMTVPAAATDGTLAAGTVTPGMVGSWWRVKYVSTGTYGGSSTLQVDVEPVMVAAGIGSFN